MTIPKHTDADLIGAMADERVAIISLVHKLLADVPDHKDYGTREAALVGKIVQVIEARASLPVTASPLMVAAAAPTTNESDPDALYNVARQAVEYVREAGKQPHFVVHADEVLATYRQTASLERMMQIAQDVKKHFSYDKVTGRWAWCDRDEVDNPSGYHGGFPTYLAALSDAVAPYLEPDGE